MENEKHLFPSPPEVSGDPHDQLLYDIMFEMLQDFERVHENRINIGEFAIRTCEKIVAFSEMYFRDSMPRLAEIVKVVKTAN